MRSPAVGGRATAAATRRTVEGTHPAFARLLDEGSARQVGGGASDVLEHDPQVALMGRLYERRQVLRAAEVFAHPKLIGDRVAVVVGRGLVEGRDPDRRNAELAQVVEAFGDACERGRAVE